MNLQTWINGVLTDQHHEAIHNLIKGWNEVRVVVDNGSQTVDLYTNGDHIIAIDDIGVENTAEITFETHTAALSAIDNVLLQSFSNDGTLQLDGENGYVELPYADSLNLTDALTIEAWVKANSRPSQVCTYWDYCNMMPIISQSNGTSSIGNYYLGIEKGFPVFGFEDR